MRENVTCDILSVINVIIDVGANQGDFCIKMAASNPQTKVLAIEPIPFLASRLRDLGNKLELSNLLVYQTAIHLQSTQGKLRKPLGGDYGKASLLQTTGESEDVALVNICRLSDILNDLNVTDIAFLKVDTQGADLAVLESMDKYLDFVKAGMIEAPAQNYYKTLYSSEPTLEESLKFLRVAGFHVYHISPNDPAIRNVNLFFNRPGQVPKEFESELNLLNVPLYSAYSYWNVNSSFRLDTPWAWAKAIFLRLLGKSL